MQDLTKELKNHLLNYFKELLQSQSTMQNFKKQHQGKINLQAQQVFQKISRKKQFISIKMFREYIKDKVACNQRQLYSIFETFDIYKYGKIYFQDFKRALLPRDFIKNHKKKNKRKVVYDSQDKGYDGQTIFIKFIGLYLKIVRVLDVWRKQLSVIPTYVYFQHLDRHLVGKIGPPDLINFFIVNNSQLSQQKSQILFSIIKKQSPYINLETFCQDINPLEKGFYKAYEYQNQQQIKKQLIQHQIQIKKAKELQLNYFRQRNNEMIVGEIHRQAALRRQKELQDRIADQINMYHQMKYQIIAKNRPQLNNYQAYLQAEKENMINNQLKIHEIERQAFERQCFYRDSYRNTMIKAQALRDVQLAKLSRNRDIYSQRLSRTYRKDNDNYMNMTTTRQLQDKIRTFRQNQLIQQGRNVSLKSNKHTMRTSNL